MGTTTATGGTTTKERHLFADRGLILFLVAAFAIPLGYALFTGQIWEDALISLRYSENLLKGEGLVYYPGQRVQGFTSPLAVLLLAMCHLFTGQSSYLATLWLYRIFTFTSFAAAGALLLQALGSVTLPRWRIATWFFATWYLFDAKAVAFSANGQETAFMLLFLAGALCLFAQGQPKRWRARGICWAGLMWCRPDSCVYIAALGLAELIFSPLVRRQVCSSLLKSAGLCTLLYGPWFLWAWSYYGSPIPHTIVAKNNFNMGTIEKVLFITDEQFIQVLIRTAAQIFRPIYCGMGPAAERWLNSHFLVRVMTTLTTYAALFCLVYCLFPVKDRLGRMASFCFAVASVYFTCMIIYLCPWYLPPAALLGLVVLARGIPTLADACQKCYSANLLGKYSKAIALGIFSILTASQISLFVLTTWQMKIQQTEIEMGTRAQIGEWLRVHGQPDQSVYLEPLGYIGYFSNMKILDWPGIVTPEVVRVQIDKKEWVAMEFLIIDLMPDWVVIRPQEYDRLIKSPLAQSFQENYKLAAVFDATKNLNQYSFIPGKDFLYNDAVFAVFKKSQQLR